MGPKKGGRIIIKMVSMAETGFFYTTKKNVKNTPEKLELMKYDPIVRKHVLFREAKMPSGKATSGRKPRHFRKTVRGSRVK